MISLMGLLAQDKVEPVKVEVPLDVAIPFNRILMSSWRPHFFVSRIFFSAFDANLKKTISDFQWYGENLLAYAK